MSDRQDKKLNIAAGIFVVMAFVLAAQGVIDGLPLHGFDDSQLKLIDDIHQLNNSRHPRF